MFGIQECENNQVTTKNNKEKGLIDYTFVDLSPNHKCWNITPKVV